jgi:hypothetical protein
MSTPAVAFSNGQIYNPVPLVSISSNPVQNKIAKFHDSYTINLVGTILVGAGAKDTVVSGGTSGTVEDGGAGKVLSIQKQITELLHTSNQLTIGNMVFQGLTVQSIDFEEGTYVNTCRYTVTLNAVKKTGDLNSHFGYVGAEGHLAATQLDTYGIEDFQETYEISSEEGQGVTNAAGTAAYARIDTITRTSTVTARQNHSITSSRYDGRSAWRRAGDYLNQYIGTNAKIYNGVADFMGFAQTAASNEFSANHARVISVDKANGSVTYTDTFTLIKGFTTSIETYEISGGSSTSSPFVTATVSGTIKGMSYWEGTEWDTKTVDQGDSPISLAQGKWSTISNAGACGLSSEVYRRANTAVSVTLNAVPTSVSVTANEITGEVSYNASYDNRPTRYFPNTISENITINDTHPGDQYAIVPVIGSSSGPVLQFTFGRTEYRRSLSLDLQFDFKNVGYGASGLAGSPSSTEPYKTILRALIDTYKPTSVGAQTAFLSPPSESWSPMDGRYSLTLEWVYG